MNKYRSAYEFIELCVRPWEHKSQELDRPVMNTQKQDNMDILKELVEKETPKKLKETTSTLRCPSCNKYVTSKGCIHKEINYCFKCGQKFDWEVEK